MTRSIGGTASQSSAQADSQADEHAALEFDREASDLTAAEKMLADLDGSGTARIGVWRVPEAGDRDSSNEFIGNWSSQQIGGDLTQLLEILRDQGGGKFQLRIRNGSLFAGPARTVRVLKPKHAAAAPAPQMQGVPPRTASSGGEPDQFEKLAKGIALITGAVAPVLTALIARPAPAPVQGLSMADVVALFKINDNQNEKRSPLGQLKELLEVKDLLVPGGGQLGSDEPGWMGLMQNLITQFGPAVAPAIAGAMTQPAKTVTGAASPAAASNDDKALPAPRPPQTADAAKAEPTDANKAAVEALIRQVLRGAAKDSDPASYADLVIDTMGDKASHALIAQADPVALLCLQVPEAANFKPWLGEMVEAMRAHYTDAATSGEIENDEP